MFGTIRAVAKGFQATLELAVVGPLTRMRSLVDLQVLQAGKGLVATGELIRAHMWRRKRKKGKTVEIFYSISADSKSGI